MSDNSKQLIDWVFRAAAALIPVLLATLIGIAWQNSHRLAVLTSDVEDVEKELTHLRGVVESNLLAPK